MNVSLVDYMGTDLSVVNAARCSFGKHKNAKEFKTIEIDNKVYILPIIDNADVKLINYLGEHGHWTPYGHCSMSFHIRAPMFVARQLGKHQVGLVWNEESRRYISKEPEFYIPENWRLRAENVKQGSSDKSIEYSIDDLMKTSLEQYKKMLEDGIAPEMARMILPQNTFTEWIWSGSLYAFARVCNLRLSHDTQWETRQVAKLINDYCEKLFPVSWAALVKKP